MEDLRMGEGESVFCPLESLFKVFISMAKN